jgi:hypothetical protein
LLFRAFPELKSPTASATFFSITNTSSSPIRHDWSTSSSPPFHTVDLTFPPSFEPH